jgi:hypothetical protein
VLGGVSMDRLVLAVNDPSWKTFDMQQVGVKSVWHFTEGLKKKNQKVRGISKGSEMTFRP